MAEPQIVKYSSGKKKFEVITKEGSVRKYRDGKMGWDNILISDEVYTNWKKGDKPNAKDLKNVFGTSDLQKCLHEIIDKGELQLSSKERKKDYEDKKGEVIYYIHKNYIDPKTHYPHPIHTLETYLEKVNYTIEPQGDTRRQAEDIVKKLQYQGIIFKKGRIDYNLSLNYQYMGKCTNIIHKFADIMSERQTSEGISYDLSIGPSEVDNFMVDLNKITKGDYELKIIGIQKVSTVESKEPKVKKESKKKRRGKKR